MGNKLAVRNAMKPVPLQILLISLVILVAAGGLTLGFGTQFFRNTVMNGSTAISSGQAPGGNTLPAAPIPEPAAALPSHQQPSAIRPPAFDIVRVEPNGDAVVAGRSAPGASVELLRGSEVLGREVADHTGEFVLLPPRLPSGHYQLALRARLADGTEVRSDRDVHVDVEARQQAPVVATPALTDQPSVMRAIAQDRNALVIEPIVVGADGVLTIKGRARPGSTIKVYLNDTFIASAVPATDLQFSVTIKKGVAPGRYRARLEQVDPVAGTVVSHAEQHFDVSAPALASGPVQINAAIPTDRTEAGSAKAPINPTPPPLPASSPSHIVVPRIETATVVRGDSLWRISRHSYGSGDLYPVIVRANRGKIRNPDLIYPSQVLVLPPR